MFSHLSSHCNLCTLFLSDTGLSGEETDDASENECYQNTEYSQYTEIKEQMYQVKNTWFYSIGSSYFLTGQAGPFEEAAAAA